MHTLNNLSIRTKVIGAFALVLMVTAVLGLFALDWLESVDAGANEVTDNWLVATRSLGAFATATMRFRQVEGSVAIAPTPEASTHEAVHLDKDVLPQVQAALAEYTPTIDSGAERALFDQVLPQWNAYYALNADYVALAQKNRAAAGKLYIGDMKTTFNKFQDALKQLIAFEVDGARHVRGRIHDTYTAAWNWIVALLALSVLFGLAAGAFIVTGVSRPIRRMTDIMARLARHDLDAPVEGTDRKDEIGRMAEAVQVFKNGIIETDGLKAEQEVARRAAEDRARALATLTSGFEAKVGEVVQAVASQATQMQASAQSMSATAEETAKQATVVAAASEQSSSNVQTVASAAEELSSSIAEISRQVGHSSRIAQTAVTEAGAANAMVVGLASASQKIGEIVALINDIADQTNLLALNATIEAARAGEAGKGFAVVASEVKNLATQTSKATDDIRAQIGAVQGATQDAVKAIDSIGATIGEIAQIVTTIAAAVEEQGAATQEIARNVEETAKGTREVSSNIAGVTAAAGGTGEAAGQVLLAARTLNGQSAALQGFVGEFLAAVKAA
ncbi:MAG TPA: methyl-accepting chemotaxis protein [Rhizomicrobium sp.]|jgi:methyl-accepting chemotaxis protein|nr:methyl-accepting chemotaxis protein [Rhizomicrobium sp.]